MVAMKNAQEVLDKLVAGRSQDEVNEWLVRTLVGQSQMIDLLRGRIKKLEDQNTLKEGKREG